MNAHIVAYFKYHLLRIENLDSWDDAAFIAKLYISAFCAEKLVHYRYLQSKIK